MRINADSRLKILTVFWMNEIPFLYLDLQQQKYFRFNVEPCKSHILEEFLIPLVLYLGGEIFFYVIN